MKNYKIKTSCVSPEKLKAQANNGWRDYSGNTDRKIYKHSVTFI